LKYEYLREFAALPREIQVLDGLLKAKTQKQAGRLIGLSERQIRRYLKDMEKRAAISGLAPDADMTHRAAEGFGVKGVSTLYNESGDVKAQWVKTQVNAEQFQENIKAAYEAIASSLPREKATKPFTAKTNKDLVNLFVVTDFHFGMLAWGEETGDDWDLKIAEDMLYDWFVAAIKRAPKASTGIIGQLGDLLHYDGLDSVTPAHHNVLDADSRFQKVVRVVIRVFRRIIREMLKHHDKVHIIHAEGNHDPASSIWLREMFAALYEDEPRVTVDVSPDPYYCYEFGKTSLFFHHGHKRKPVNIDAIFAAKFRDTFGRTNHSYAHMGHLHHKVALETSLMIVEQHRTLASPDAFASRGGWISGRGASVISYHSEYGEVGRACVTPEMLK
jgi:hypothetical protein